MNTDDDRRDARGTGARVLGARAVLDAAAAAELRRETKALLARSADPLVVDLTGVRVAEAAARGVLRELAYEAGEADVDFRVVRDAGAPEVTRPLLDDEALFEIFPSVDAALRRRAEGRMVRAGRPRGRSRPPCS
jgi:anti-anti-sigma regulatory factor